jgi:D-threo-aldose 1-dehydrogenase
MPHLYGYDVAAEDAIATVLRTFESPINFIDTSNNYGNGESEKRIGQAIAVAGGLPHGFVLATKADPLPGSREFTGERVMSSLKESLLRLRVERVPVFYLHDPEQFEFDQLVQAGGVVDAMKELKSRGLVDRIGVAGGSIPEMRRYVDTGVFDILLNHSQYTLLDRTADELINHAVAAGLSFINAAPYASGMLAKPADTRPRYQYREPDRMTEKRVARLRDVCADYDVPLAAVALQFSTRDRRISSTVVGVSSPARVDELVTNASLEIPATVWDEVEDVLA